MRLKTGPEVSFSASSVPVLMSMRWTSLSRSFWLLCVPFSGARAGVGARKWRSFMDEALLVSAL